MFSVLGQEALPRLSRLSESTLQSRLCNRHVFKSSDRAIHLSQTLKGEIRSHLRPEALIIIAGQTSTAHARNCQTRFQCARLRHKVPPHLAAKLGARAILRTWDTVRSPRKAHVLRASTVSYIMRDWAVVFLAL